VSQDRPAAAIVLIVAAFTVLTSACVCVAAVLAPAPPGALPMVVAVCIGCPMFASWQVPFALTSLQSRRARDRALARLRRHLAALPETEHPLGL
jgi:hypothetical protein